MGRKRITQRLSRLFHPTKKVFFQNEEKECKKPLCLQKLQRTVLWGTPQYGRKGEGTPDPEAYGSHACIFCRANAKEEHGVGSDISNHQTRTATEEFSTLPTATRTGERSTREEGRETVSPYDVIRGTANL